MPVELEQHFDVRPGIATRARFIDPHGPIDLTTAKSIECVVASEKSTWRSDVQVLDAKEGLVGFHVPWAPTAPATYKVEFQIRWPGGGLQHIGA